MKVSTNWIKSYLPINESPERLSEILTQVGLEVEGSETVETIKGGLKGVVVGEVVTCEKHPDADRLSVTTVNVGTDVLPIVCGAPNVAKGQKVLVATIGTTLFPTEGEPLAIKKGKIRGKESHGMICAADEIGMGTDHSGIMVLREDATIGMPAANYFHLETDTILDVNLTPNRSDATSHLGVSRDLYAYFKTHAEGIELTEPPIAAISNKDVCPIKVVVENTEACPRYSGIYIDSIVVKESPEWLKNRLLSIGVRPINNIVDITNFVLHELGQPLHAFDADKIKGNEIRVKTLADGTDFIALDEQKRTLEDTDLMICDANSNPMCIGGVYGGLDSGVSEQTTAIFLESAHFHAKWIRRSSMHHNLRTDAAKCFEKGSDPNITVFALQRALYLIEELQAGKLRGGLVDIYPTPIMPQKVKVSIRRIQQLIGYDIPKDVILNILDAMNMEVQQLSDDAFEVAVPTNKADVLREADIVEEVLRIYGFDNIPITNQIKTALSAESYSNLHRFRNKVGDYLASVGFFEMMNLSLSSSQLGRDYLHIEDDKQVFLNIGANTALDVMRPSMIFGGLESIVYNQNRQHPDLKFFEFGKTYTKTTEGQFSENEHLTLFMTGKSNAESWLNTDRKESLYFDVKAYTLHILNLLGIKTYQQEVLEQTNEFDFGSIIKRGKSALGAYGRLSDKIRKKYGIKNAVYYATLDLTELFGSLKEQTVQYQEISRFPSVRRDLAFVIDEEVTFDKIVKMTRSICKNYLKEINLFDVYKNKEQLGEGKKSYSVSFHFEDTEKTLEDKYIDQVMERLIQEAEKQLKAIIRK